MPRISKELQAIKTIFKENGSDQISFATMPKKVVRRLIIHLKSIDDIRQQGMIDYRMDEIIVMTFIATLAMCDTWIEIERFCKERIKFFKKFLKIRNGIPSHDTFKRVFGLIDPSNFNKVIIDFFLDSLSALKKALGIKANDDEYKHLAVDCKELKGSGRLYKGSNTIRNTQILNVYDNTNEVCLFSKVISNKTNEIPIAREILSELNLKKTVVTFDSIHTQKETINIIAKREGDYIGGLKANQENLYNDVVLYFTDEEKNKIINSKHYYETSEKSHSQIETRKYYLTTNVNWFFEKDKWAKLTGFIMYEKSIIKNDKKTLETRYYITSLKDVKFCAECIRGHWSVENNLHWQLDYAFKEDEQTTIDKNALANLSVMKKLALALINLNRHLFKGDSIRVIRKRMGWSTETNLNTLLSTIDEGTIINLIK